MYEQCASPSPFPSRLAASPQASLPRPSSLRISLPHPDVKTGIRGVAGMCTVMILLLGTFILAG